MKNYLAIDMGATSIRVILAAVSGRTVDTEVLHRFPTPLVSRDGGFFWDIDTILREILKGIGLARGRDIESIGVNTWGVDFCPVLPDGTLGAPHSYRDPYTNGVPEQFFRQMPAKELYRRTGIQIMNFNTVFQLFAQSRSGSLNGISRILFIPDAVSYYLTGRMVCEYTILSTSGLMNPYDKTPDGEILKICGISPQSFGEPVMPGTVIGTLKPEIASATGLGEVRVVAVAGHDTASAVAAVPATAGSFSYLSSGTWSLMGIETDRPVINDMMFESNFTNEGGAGGNCRLLKNITGMWLLEQCLSRWKSEGRDYSYGELAGMASACPESENLIDPDAPQFASPTDMPAAIAAAAGRSLSDAQTVRLIYDSLTAKYAEVFRKLETIAGRSLDVLHIIGGGSMNRLLNQLTADKCGVKVVAGPSECTALGNIMIQAGLTRADLAASAGTETFLPSGQPHSIE